MSSPCSSGCQLVNRLSPRHARSLEIRSGFKNIHIIHYNYKPILICPPKPASGQTVNSFCCSARYLQLPSSLITYRFPKPVWKCLSFGVIVLTRRWPAGRTDGIRYRHLSWSHKVETASLLKKYRCGVTWKHRHSSWFPPGVDWSWS